MITIIAEGVQQQHCPALSVPCSTVLTAKSVPAVLQHFRPSELTSEDAEKLLWLLAETYEPERLTAESSVGSKGTIVEVGPRLNFSTAWSANAVSICESCGISNVDRIEQSRRCETKRHVAFELRTGVPCRACCCSAVLLLDQ